MSSISITKQYNELDEYTQIKEYIDKVLDNFSDLNNLDSNDIYEIIYAKKLCDSKLVQGIENYGTRAAFEDTSARLSLIIDLLTDDIIKKALKNPLNKDKINKVNSSKHAKSNKLPNLPDKSKPRFANPIQEYSKRLISKLVILTIVLLFIINGQDIAEILTDSILGIMSNDAQSTTQVAGQMPEAFEKMSGFVSLIGSFLAVIIMCTTSVSMIIDIMYIAFPAFRYMVDSRKSDGLEQRPSIVSDFAVEAVQLGDTVVGYHYSNNADKVGTAKILLDNMLSSLRKPENKNDESEEHIYDLLRIKNKVNECKNMYEKIKYLADVEIYYINNRIYFDSILKED